MQHPLNRHLFIADNLNLLRRLDNESVDLICIDPPFAKNQTFTGSLRPPLTDAERQLERDTLAAWGIHTPADAANAGHRVARRSELRQVSGYLALGKRRSRGLDYPH